MNQFLLDTDTCVFIAKNYPPVRARFAQLERHQLCISVITFGELWFGVEKMQNRDIGLQQMAALLSQVEVLPVTESAALQYAILRHRLQKQGEITGTNDLWIAAQALSFNLILVTNNEREFRRVPDLRLENWMPPRA